jgi:2-polyprenyl-3-methyl-5-hydroxy-6-metoxy-1,4-benzoquinol methylase
MDTLDQDIEQVYRSSTVVGYKGFRNCDLNVYDWTRAQLTPERVRSKIVIDAGCGKAPFFSHLDRAGARQMIGIDGSEQMLTAAEHVSDQVLLRWPVSEQLFHEALGARQRILLRACGR